MVRSSRIAIALCASVLASLLSSTVASAASGVTAAPAVTSTSSSAIRDGVLHHRGDPRQGTIRIQAMLRYKLFDDNTYQMQAFATVSGVNQVVRVQIDRVSLSLENFLPFGSSWPIRAQRDDRTPVNSGAGSSVSKGTEWVGLGPGSYQPNFRRIAEVAYSTRWQDGTVTRGVFSSDDEGFFEPSPVQNPVLDSRSVDAAGTVTLAHLADPARGTVRIDVGLRLYRSLGLQPGYQIDRIQPFATIAKGHGVLRVQIDALEGVRFYDFPDRPDGDPLLSQSPTAWPSNTTVRSSGTSPGVSLSTPISPVTAQRQGPLAYFRVVVLFSVRWTDGRLTRGFLAGPLSGLGYVVQRDGLG